MSRGNLKDGSNYKDFYYYGYKHRNITRGHKCDYKKQVQEEMLDASVAEVISRLVSNACGDGVPVDEEEIVKRI